MTTLLLPGTSQTALAIATHFHASSPAHPYLLGTRASSPTDTYTVPATLSHPSLTHPTVTISLTDPTTWAPAFTLPAPQPQISTLYLLPPPTLPNFIPTIKSFITFATSHGVTRIVWLSASLIPRGGPAHGEVHAYLHELALASHTPSPTDGSAPATGIASATGPSPLEYAVLKPTWFTQNFTSPSHFHTHSIRQERKVYSATDKAKLPWVSVRDIGAVGYFALTAAEGAATEGREYLILGPELLSYDQVAGVVAGVLGRGKGDGNGNGVVVEHVKMSVEGLEERFKTLGVPGEYAGVLAGLDAVVESGADERLGGCVREVLGREGESVLSVLEGAGREGVWE